MGRKDVISVREKQLVAALRQIARYGCTRICYAGEGHHIGCSCGIATKALLRYKQFFAPKRRRG